MQAAFVTESHSLVRLLRVMGSGVQIETSICLQVWHLGEVLHQEGGEALRSYSDQRLS